MESTTGEDAMKIAEMTTKDLQHYINLADKAEAGLERINSTFERSSTIGKMLQTASYREIIPERKSESMQQTTMLSLELPVTPNVQQPSKSRQDSLFLLKKIFHTILIFRLFAQKSAKVICFK